MTKERDREPTAEQVAMKILMHLAALYDQIERATMAGTGHPSAVYAPAPGLVTAVGEPQRLNVVAVQIAPVVLRDAREVMKKFRVRRAAGTQGAGVPS